MARALVVGGNGLIGSALVDRLVDDGHEVAVFDRYSNGTSHRADGVEVIVGDLADEVAVEAALEGRDTLVHLISVSTPASADDDPVTDIHDNVARSVRLLQSAVEAGIRRVHFASTGGAMYGRDASRPSRETDAPDPVSPYAIGKLAVEGYLRYFAVKHGLDSIVHRISNPYGSRQHPDRVQGVIPIFLDRIASGRPITVLGDGSATRDFVHVDDVARMIAATVDRPARHAVYNVGSGEATSLAHVIELCAEVAGHPVTIERGVEPSTFVHRSVLDIARAVDEFGVAPVIGLREGIERTWAERSAGERP